MADLIADVLNMIGGKQAADDQAQYIGRAQQVQGQQYGQGIQYLAPYQMAGRSELGTLQTDINQGVFNPQFQQVSPQTLASDPGYQFRMQQGMQALQRSAAAGGRLGSGAFMKGLDQYSQGLASQEYNNAFNRNLSLYQAQQTAAQNQYGRLANLVNMGYGAANGMAGLGQNYANNMSSLYGAMGNNRAAGDMAIYGGIANTLNDGANTVASIATGGLGGFGGGGGGGFSGLMRGGGGGYNTIPAQSFYGGGGGYGGGGYEDVIPAQPMS